MPKSARYGHRGKTGLGFRSFGVSESPKSHVIPLEAPIPIFGYVLAEVVKVTEFRETRRLRTSTFHG